MSRNLCQVPKVRPSQSGFTLIEVLAVIAVLGLFFGGLFAAFEFSFRLIEQSRSKLSALSLATDRLEYIRSLSYDQVGTVFGIPPGNIPQNRVVNLNGRDFFERVLIDYVDDPGDGLGVLDDNNVITDYKKVKIEYEWLVRNSTTSFALISTVVPRGIETNVGGGSVRVNVFDALVNPLPGISVRLVNTSTTPPINTARFTNPSGIALFTGAPAAAGYEIFVSAPGFTSSQTIVPSSELPNPNTLPVAVLASDVTTMNFQIDRVSQLNLRFLSTRDQPEDVIDFSAPRSVIIATNVATSGSLRLTETAGVYAPAGEAWLAPFTPAPLLSWGWFKRNANVPTGTNVTVQFYTSTSSGDIIPDTALPGNSVGFVTTSVDLRGLSSTTYPTIVARLRLETSNSSLTPEVTDVTWSYLASEAMASGVDFTLSGTKIIGTLADHTPVPKFSTTTNSGSGLVTLSNMEWDLYRLNMGSGQVIREACPGHPFSLAPNSSQTVELLLGPTSANNLRVTAQTGGGVPVVGALVELERTGFSASAVTGWCGQVYFGSLLSSSDYILRVGAPGFATSTITNYSLSGTNEMVITLNP